MTYESEKSYEATDQTVQLQFVITLVVVILGTRLKKAYIAQATELTRLGVLMARNVIWVTPRCLPVMAFMLDFYMSSEVLDAVFNKDPDAWSKLQVAVGMTVVSCIIPAYWLANWWEGDEEGPLLHWLGMLLLLPIVLTLAMVVSAMFSRFVWSVLV